MQELLAIINLVLAAAAVITTLQFRTRCTQIEHIELNVSKTEKVKASLQFLNRARKNLRTIATWLCIAAIYSGFVLAAFFWAEQVENLRNLTLGSAVVSVVAILFLESRASKHTQATKTVLQGGVA